MKTQTVERNEENHLRPESRTRVNKENRNGEESGNENKIYTKPEILIQIGRQEKIEKEHRERAKKREGEDKRGRNKGWRERERE